MGRREDGAAVRDGRRCAQNLPGRPSGEIRPPSDAVPWVVGKRSLRHSGDGGASLPGNRTRRQELADERGWSTFRKRGPTSRKRRCGAPVGASLLTKEGGDAFAKRPTGWSRRPSIGGFAHPRVCRRSAPLEGVKNWTSARACPGPTSRIRAMSHACAV